MVVPPERISAGPEVNLVPITALLTALVDQGKVSIEDLDRISDQCVGTLHFRPNNRETHGQVRRVMAKLLGLS